LKNAFWAEGSVSITPRFGDWRIVVLNTNCNTEGVGGCRVGSPQEQWLRADLAAHPTACTLAYWHDPRYSFGTEGGGGGDDVRSQALWQALDEHGAELVLTGHAHNYQRYTPLDATGVPDPMRSIRQFVVGTGGANHTPLGTKPSTAEVGNDTTFGILQLSLHPTSYEWQFVPIPGKTFTDSGSDS
jgi:3',5'-cyclic AMP phosphodiesterase CpdA